MYFQYSENNCDNSISSYGPFAAKLALRRLAPRLSPMSDQSVLIHVLHFEPVTSQRKIMPL